MARTPNKLFSIAAIVVLAAVSLLAGLRSSPGERCSIWIDAARPISIEPPMEIVEIGEHGELGLHLPTEAPSGWKGEAGGEATYRFYAPQDGSYVIWAWCLWHDECTNAVYAQVDELPKAILGNDPVYSTWHWVKGFDVPLKKGFHRLTFSNHSANIAIRTVFLTNDCLLVPPDTNPSLASVLFTDDFNGCDQGNFPMWRTVSGTWRTSHPADRKNTADNVLLGTSEGEALIVFDSGSWREICLTVSVFCDSPTDGDAFIGLRFAVADENHYQEIRLSPLPDGQMAVAEHIRCEAGVAQVLAWGRIPWRQASWHELHLDLSGSRPSLLLDGGASFTGGDGGAIGGGIGFSLHGCLTASFDNVLVESGGGE
jgi:hypothetical protein